MKLRQAAALCQCQPTRFSFYYADGRVFKHRLQQDKQTARQVFSRSARAQIATPHMYASPLKKSDLPRPFNIGVPALHAFPFKVWEKLVAQRARRLSPVDYNYQHALAGYPPLCEAIATHLTITRRLHCTPEQIIIVPGTQGALIWLLAR